MNQLILGDCLEVLKKIESESIDLIYLDPPFFSNRNYEIIWGDAGEIRSFQDRWSGGIDHYIAWLKERVIEMHRVLKSTGSIFLHCDWHANAHIRVYILDKIFGEQNFRNEIIWKRTNAKGLAFTRFAMNHDTIFYYSKSDKYIWNPQYSPHNKDYIEKFYNNIESNTGRKYQLADLTNPNKDRPNLTYEFLGITRVWRWTKERMQEAYQKGLIIQQKRGAVPRLKRYLDEQEGNPVDDCWTDLLNVQVRSKESIGYPTQKPEALLERIIRCATNEGDLVLDPFVGGGTSVVVAEKLNRTWIGIDQSVAAVKISEFRLYKNSDLFSKPFVVQLHKYDYDTLRYKDAFEFETWIIAQFGGVSNTKQKSDLGIDGRTREGKPIQVKRAENIGRNVIDNFVSACKRYDKNLFDKNVSAKETAGIIIAFSFGKGAIQEAARLKNEENLIIELIKVEDVVPIAKKPTLTLMFNDLGNDKKGLHQIEFIAQGQSEAGIEFYAWDFDYDEKNKIFKPSILRDKDGKQVKKFEAGIYCIAVKVIDNDGLESLEVIKLKINGNIEREIK